MHICINSVTNICILLPTESDLKALLQATFKRLYFMSSLNIGLDLYTFQ